MSMAAEKLHTIFFRGLVHGVAFRQGHRHGFFDNDVFSAARRGDRVLSVQGIGCGDVNCVNTRLFAHGLNARVCFAVVNCTEFSRASERVSAAAVILI